MSVKIFFLVYTPLCMRYNQPNESIPFLGGSCHETVFRICFVTKQIVFFNHIGKPRHFPSALGTAQKAI